MIWHEKKITTPPMNEIYPLHDAAAGSVETYDGDETHSNLLVREREVLAATRRAYAARAALMQIYNPPMATTERARKSSGKMTARQRTPRPVARREEM